MGNVLSPEDHHSKAYSKVNTARVLGSQLYLSTAQE